MRRLRWQFAVSLLVFLLTSISASTTQEDSLRYCEHYTECTAVSRLEERLCMGNTRLRPYWLPSYHDPKKCYEKLKNDYKLIEHLEVQLERSYLACLIERTIPMNEEESSSRRCSQHLMRDAPRFSFARTITYIPTNCFAGLEKRMQRQCGRLKQCCGAVDRCASLLVNAQEVRRIDGLRNDLWDRAKKCERGIPIPTIELSAEILRNDDEKLSWSPSGNITLTVRDRETYEREQAAAAASHRRGNDDGGHSESEWLDKQRRERLGQISRPFQLRNDKFTKVNFPEKYPQRSNELRRSNAQLSTTDGDLTIEVHHSTDPDVADVTERPTLQFPSLPGKRKFHGPTTIEEHNVMFKEALRNTETYKQKETKNTEKAMGEALDSLLEAGRVSSQTISLSADSGQAAARDGEGRLQEGKAVTSEPVILVKPAGGGRGCRPGPARIAGAKLLGFDRVMQQLGEDEQSESMKELRSILDSFQTDIRGRLVEAKERSDDDKVQDVLSRLISNFDAAQAELIKARQSSNATFDAADYPEDDALIAGSICDPLPKGEGDDGLQRDEHDDKILLQDGKTKLVLDHGNLALEAPPVQVAKGEEEEMISGWHNEDYKRELEEWKQKHHLLSAPPVRNETACDLYMRCRNQMHLALDGCAWRFAASRILPSLAESAESLLYRGDELCDGGDRPLYEDLYEMVISRNGRLRGCLRTANQKFFESSVCIPFPVSVGHEYEGALVRVLSAEYNSSSECFHDANLIQEKCSRLRSCCPNFDKCRDETMNISEEQAIISLTAKVNEKKQECLRRKAREQFQLTLRELLGKGGPNVLKKIKNKQFLGRV